MAQFPYPPKAEDVAPEFLDALLAPEEGPPEPTGPSALNFKEAEQVRTLVTLLATRKVEALRIYEPLPVIEAFHRSRAPERLIRGGNRSGKTLGAMVEIARAVTRQDPHGKYPDEGRAWLVGHDGKHMGEVIYRKLMRAGAFKMIKDLQTDEWRAFRPKTDAAREKEAKPAPPLIPARFVKSISWENKKSLIPSLVRLTTGWELSFFSSNAVPGQGSDIDLCDFDEEIENDSWYAEVAARLLDRHGKFIWNATPQASTQQLYDLSQRAEAGDKNVSEHIAMLGDNPHIADEEKQKLAAKLTDAERRVRIYGEFALTGYTVYPEFAMSIHGCEPFPIPADWCTFMAVDPGRQICAALFCAIPPPGALRPEEDVVQLCKRCGAEMDDVLAKDGLKSLCPQCGYVAAKVKQAPPWGDHVYLYDEIYVAHCDAVKFADAVHDKLAGRTQAQEFLIDHHAGRVTEMGSGRNVEDQYSAALKEKGIKSFATGTGFVWGSDDVKAGLQAFRSLLRIRPDGSPRLQVFAGRLPRFEWEIKRYRYKALKTNEGKLPSDEPDQKNNHLVDCGRYLAMRGLTYTKPPKAKAQKGYAVKYLEEKKARIKERSKRMRSYSGA